MVKSASFILIIVFLAVLVTCHTSKTDIQKSGDQDYKAIAIEKYGHNVAYIFNSPKTDVICLKRNKPTPQMPQHQISFFIYDLEKGEVIFEESSVDAEVKWKNDHQAQIKITPGIVSGDETPEDFIYIYDVESRKKIKQK